MGGREGTEGTERRIMMCLILGSGIRAMRFCSETALIPELYLQSGWNGMRRKEAEVGGREK